VSYANGETPVPGDYVKNELEQPGTVTRVSVVSNGDEPDEFVTIRWDGGLDSPLTRAKDFTLISRGASPGCYANEETSLRALAKRFGTSLGTVQGCVGIRQSAASEGHYPLNS
jgi:hypothetical protein